LLDLRNFGRKCLEEVKRALATVVAPSGPPDSPGTDVCAREVDDVHTATSLSRGGWKLPQAWAGIADEPIDLLDLSTRGRNVLARLRIATLGQLLEHSKLELKETENVGRKTIAEIEERIFSYLAGQGSTATGWEPNVPDRRPSEVTGIKQYVDLVLGSLSGRDQSVLADRYGLWDGIAETLHDIGDKLGVTRERIRQIETKAIKRIRRLHAHDKIARFMLEKVQAQMRVNGSSGAGVINEEEAIASLAVNCTLEEAVLAVEFLQDIVFGGEDIFVRCLIEAEPGVYCVDHAAAYSYQEVVHQIELSFKAREKPLTTNFFHKELASRQGAPLSAEQCSLVGRALEISSHVRRLGNGTIVLSEWTESISQNAAGLAEAALRSIGRPAHFREIAHTIGTLFGEAKVLNERTVHHALLGDGFTWVKSGTYGLATWGLKRPPYIKDRLLELLSAAEYPLPLWHLQEKVLEICNCKLNSVKMTLDLNPKLFTSYKGDQYGLTAHTST
jgi:hypothetical protein